jgi:hypothetical protein
VEGVKFHSLYLIPGTRLAEEYQHDSFPLLSQEGYAQIVAEALELLPPDTIIQRLTGDPPPDIPAYPAWTRDKNGTLQKISAVLEKRDGCQGTLYRK